MATDASDTSISLPRGNALPKTPQKRKSSSSHKVSTKRGKAKNKRTRIGDQTRQHKRARRDSYTTTHMEPEIEEPPEKEWELWYISKVCRPVEGAELYFYCRWVEYADQEADAWEPESVIGHAPEMINELFTDLLSRARAAVEGLEDIPLAVQSSLLNVDRFKNSLQTGVIYAASAQRIRETKADTLSNARPEEKRKFKRDMSPGPNHDMEFRCTDARSLRFVVEKARRHEGILEDSSDSNLGNVDSLDTTPPRAQENDTSTSPSNSPTDVDEQDTTFSLGEHTENGESFDSFSTISSKLADTASDDIATPAPSRSPSSTPSLGTASMPIPAPPTSITRPARPVISARPSVILRVSRPAAAIPPNPTRRRLAEKDETPAQVSTPDDSKLMTPQDYAMDVRTETTFRKETTGQRYVGMSMRASRLPGFLRSNPKQRQLPSQGEATNLLKEGRHESNSQPTFSRPKANNGWGAASSTSAESSTGVGGWGSNAASSWGSAPTAGWGSGAVAEDAGPSWDTGGGDDFGSSVEPSPDSHIKGDNALSTADITSPGDGERNASRGPVRGPSLEDDGRNDANAGSRTSQDVDVSRSPWAVPSFRGGGWSNTSGSQVAGWGALSGTATAGWGSAPTIAVEWEHSPSSGEPESAALTPSASDDTGMTPSPTPSNSSQSAPNSGTSISSTDSGGWGWGAASVPVAGWGVAADTSTSWSNFESSNPERDSGTQTGSLSNDSRSSTALVGATRGSSTRSDGNNPPHRSNDRFNHRFVPMEERPRDNGWATRNTSGRPRDQGLASRNRAQHSSSGSAASPPRGRGASVRPRGDGANRFGPQYGSVAGDRRSSSGSSRGCERRESQDAASAAPAAAFNASSPWPSSSWGSSDTVSGGWGVSSAPSGGGWSDSIPASGGWGSSAPAAGGGWGAVESSAPAVDTTPAGTSEPVSDVLPASPDHSSNTEASHSTDFNANNAVSSANLSMGTSGGWNAAWPDATGWDTTVATGWATTLQAPASPQWGGAEGSGSTATTAKDTPDKGWRFGRSPPRAPRQMRIGAVSEMQRDSGESELGRGSDRDRHERHSHRNRSPSPMRHLSQLAIRDKRTPSPLRKSIDYGSLRHRPLRPGVRSVFSTVATENVTFLPYDDDAATSSTESHNLLKCSTSDKPRHELSVGEPGLFFGFPPQEFSVVADEELEEGEIRPNDILTASSSSSMNHTAEAGDCTLAMPEGQPASTAKEQSQHEENELEHIRDDLCSDFVVAVPDIV